MWVHTGEVRSPWRQAEGRSVGCGSVWGSIRSGQHIHTMWGVAHSWGMVVTGVCQHSERES